MERLLLVLLVIAVAFVLVSKFIAEATIRLICQVVLAVVLIWFVIRFAS